MMYGEYTPTISYGSEEDGSKVFVRVCPNCGRFVKADKECFVNDDSKANATCKRCGRVRMDDLGWF